MRSTDLVVAKRPDEEEVTDVRVRHEMLEQLEGRRIQPLQIVEKEGERVLLAGEYAQKGAEHHVKTTLSLRGREGRNRWLPADDELELGNEADNELTIEAHGFADRLAPTLDLCLAL